MERPGDVDGRRRLITCTPCERRGSYNLNGLRRRFGELACNYEVFVRLTPTWRWQHEIGARQPNQ